MTDNTVIVLDVETTGLDFTREKMVEFAALKLVNGQIVEEYETLINPKQHIRNSSIKIHGITEDMVKDAPVLEEVMPKILDFIKDYPIVGHNVIFDYSYLNKASVDLYQKELTNPRIDTQQMFKEVFPDEFSCGLDALMTRMGVTTDTRHRAMADARGLALSYPRLEALYQQKNAWQMSQLENVDYLFERYLRIQDAIQIMHSELSDIKSIFKVYFEQGGREITSSTGEVLSYGSKVTHDYDISQIKDTLKEIDAWDKVIRVNNGLIDRILTSNGVSEENKEKLSQARVDIKEVRNIVIQKPDKIKTY